jgi:hypothetical protein
MVTAIVLALSIALPMVSATTQERPALTGTWTLAADQAPQPPDQLRFIGFGQVFSVAQDGTTLRITRRLGESERTAVYHLDGSESRNLFPLGQETSRVRWDGATLVITTITAVTGRTGQHEGILAMSIDGSGRLVLESRGQTKAALKYQRN